MRLADIANRLGYQFKIVDTETSEIDTLEIAAGPVQRANAHCLYFCDEVSEAFNVSGVNLAIPEELSVPVMPEGNILFLPKGKSLETSFSEVRGLMEQELHDVYSRIKLMEALIDDMDMQSFINLCAEVLENAVSFGDMNNQLIAHSTNYSAEGLLWEEHEKMGHFSGITMGSQDFQTVDKMIQKADEPIILYQPITGHNSITGKVVVDNIHVSYFSVIDTNRPFREGDKRMVGTICRLLETKSPSAMPSIFHYGKLVQMLLGEHENNWIVPALEFERLHFSDRYQVLLIREDERGNGATPLSTVTALLAGRLPDQMVARYNDSVVIMVPDAIEFLQSTSPLSMDQFLRENTLCIGVSRPASTEKQFKQCYEQAEKAIELGKKIDRDRNTFYYEEYATYHLWQTLSQVEDLKKYCHPAIFELMEYDKKHQSSFCETLEMFLVCGGNRTKTAERLSIHKSSLLYRLEKLQEVVSLDLEDFCVRAHLYNTFQILRIL